MARVSRLRADLAAWGVGDIAANELNEFDERCFRALSEEGGLWNATTEIEIAGQGIRTTEVNGSWTCDGSPTAVGWSGATFTASSADGFAFNTAKAFTITVPPVIMGDGTADWSYVGGSLMQHVLTNPVARIPIHPPMYATLTDVYLYLIATGTRAALPATLPNAILTYTTPSVGIAVTNVTAISTDSPADLAAYQAIHSIHLTMSHQVSAHNYFVVFGGEAGVNSLVDSLYCTGIQYVYTATSLRSPT